MLAYFVVQHECAITTSFGTHDLSCKLGTSANLATDIHTDHTKLHVQFCIMLFYVALPSGDNDDPVLSHKKVSPTCNTCNNECFIAYSSHLFVDKTLSG